MSGGETTCSHTSPRSSVMDEMRSPYDSSGRVSSQRSREQTEVASSRHVHAGAVLANSEKMLFGWSAEIGSRSFAGRSPSMIAGCARSVES